MLPTTETACFAIADISGYTRFVSAVELDHAQDIIADIMDTLVRALRPPFRLAKFESDAAFVYAPAGKLDGSLLPDQAASGAPPASISTSSWRGSGFSTMSAGRRSRFWRLSLKRMQSHGSGDTQIRSK